jgi:AraC family L-rhamnose operon regulatory protein RhaS
LALAEENVTPSDYIRMVRLEECARSLIENCATGKSITNIAFDSGFNSSSYFSTQFRRHFGVSPRSYRAQLRGTPVTQ